MQKFGLFDVIEKILPLSKAINEKTTNEKSPQQNDKQKNIPTHKIPSKNNNFAPYCALMKRHDEISKRIDKQNKQSP